MTPQVEEQRNFSGVLKLQKSRNDSSGVEEKMFEFFRGIKHNLLVEIFKH